MTSEKTPYEMAEEILGLAQALVLELGGHDSSPSGNAGKGKQVLDLTAEVAQASAPQEPSELPEEAPGEASGGEDKGSRKLVGASWAPRSWS
jgi:hypothetical protein